MARTQQPRPNQVSKGPIEGYFHHFGDNVWKFHGPLAPVNGTSGDGAGWAGPGSEYTDRTGAKLYINTGTKASPVWTVVGAQTA